MTGRILIADSVAGERIVLKARLVSHAYDIVQATTAQQVTEIARAAPPDLILLPQLLGDCDGIDLFKALKARAETRRIPVILRLARGDVRTRLRALEAGVDAVIDMSAEPALLGARIRNLLRRSASEADLPNVAVAGNAGFAEPAALFEKPGEVVIVAPRVEDVKTWRDALAKRLRERIRVLPERTALASLARGTRPDAVVVMENPETPERALHLISELRCRSHTMRAALLLVQDVPAPERAATALDIGLSDVVDTGFEPEEMALRLRRELAHKKQADRLRAALKDGLKMASTDPLTGLYNRRYAMAKLERMNADAVRDGSQYAVMLIDLDRFKSINDRHGHAAGDTVLVEVAARMRACLRPGDLLARIGGEEFLAVVRRCDLATAKQTADRIRTAIGSRPIFLPGGNAAISVTASIGLKLSVSGKAEDCDFLLSQADRALYGAKAEGRNQVTVSIHAA